MAAKYDYEMLEREYVTSDLSIRALCERHTIGSWSAVAAQAKKREWDRKRQAFKDKAFDADIAVMANKRAIKLQQTFEDAVDVIDAAFLKVGIQLNDPTYIVSIDGLAKLIDKLLLLTGGATSREEVRHLNLNADLSPEQLRDIQAAARATGAGKNTVGQSALPIAAGPRQVN